MSQIVNSHQAEAWNGYEGQHWANHQDRYDAVNQGFNEPLLRAAGIGATHRVLDIGCGCGQTARLAARQAVRGEVVGVDLSVPMLERASRTATRDGIRNVVFTQGDAQVHDFPEADFDVAISRFGIMFFADPPAGFGNIGRALRPGGRIAFLSLRALRDSELGGVLAAMRPYLPADQDTDDAGPESLADPYRIHTVLAAAGFGDVTCTPVEAPQIWGRDAEDAARFLAGWGPIRYRLDQIEEAAAGHARAALLSALRPYQQQDAVRTLGTAWLVTATRP